MIRMPHPVRRLAFLLGVSVVLAGSTAYAQQPKEIEAPEPRALGSGMDCAVGTAEAFLDINNVRARVLNNGALFYDGSPSVYEVPKGGETSALFTASLWVAGRADGVLKATSSNYGWREFWPGPLDEDGNPPADCTTYDRIYNVSVRDFLLYERYGLLTPDLRDWPHDLGAPVRDGDDIPWNYNLEGGDRPAIVGHQTLWWRMHDLGGPHEHSKLPPVGLDVQAAAFAVASDEPALHDAIFYRYRMRYRGEAPLEDAYVALFVDVDLGNAADDYVGSDTTLGMGFAYNGDDDEGEGGYGVAPPAVGIDFLQGPMIAPDGKDNNRDGQVDETGERLPMTAFVFNDEMHEGYGGEVLYNHIRGRWFHGEPIVDGCLGPGPVACGAGSSGDTTGIMVPGDPVTRQFWSEMNYRQGQPNIPSDRKMLVSSGPFTMQPGDEQEIVFAVVWARGSDHLDSVARLREADRVVQAAWDAGFDISLPERSPPADTPTLVAPADGALGQPTRVILRWEPVDRADAYLLELARDLDFTNGITRIVSSSTDYTPDFRERAGNTFVTLDTLARNTTYYWRLRGLNTAGLGPPTPVRRFSTGDGTLRRGEVLHLSDGSPAFVEVAGPGAADPCGASSQNTFGCDEVGGAYVYHTPNSTGDFFLTSSRQTEEYLGYFAPHDFEIRFTAEGSYALHFSDPLVSWVPFEVWDIGSTALLTENNPDDDIRLLPVLQASDECRFFYGQTTRQDPLGQGWLSTSDLSAYYPATTYADWAAAVREVVDADPDRCAVIENPWDYRDRTYWRSLLHFAFFGNPDGPHYRPEGPPEGTVIRLYTTSYGTTPPVPSAPGDGSILTASPVTLWWNAARDRRGRLLQNHIQLAASPDFQAIVAEDSLTQEFYTVSDLTPGETYYWRIRSRDGSGLFSAWSDVWRFTAGMPTAVEANEAGIPTTFELQANYPNPFNPATTIRFGVPQAGRVRLVVYDVLGRKVTTLVDEALSPGWHETRWEASGLSSGVYFYRLSSGGFQAQRMMVLVH